MSATARTFLTFALAAAFGASLPANARTVPVNPPKFTPKINGVTQSNDAATLAAQLVGTGVTIGNATFTGAPDAAGTFIGGQASVGIDTGIVLSTGQAINVRGPNESGAWSDTNGTPGDARLDALVAPEVTFDAAVLAFDVVPTADTISIRFVFASEEYNEFVDSSFNDVLAIFVNGVNCATFDGRPISVNTINAGLNPGLFIDNTGSARNTEMDGLTVPLDCTAAVNPGVANRVVIAIADTADPFLDAVVLLAAGGIRSPGVGPLTNSTVLKAIEFRHAGFDHYFITTIADEIVKLDNGTFAGWSRTGQAFNVFVLGTAGTSDVCRFFSTAFNPKSSHFYTPFAPECATVKANPNWQFEAAVFGVLQPAADGSCQAGSVPLYRVYNDGQGGAPNHRYTTDAGEFALMQALGWKPEGFGVGVIACVPI